jgi:hypothetical protein
LSAAASPPPVPAQSGPRIIRPFRWWKTCGIFAAVFFGAMLVVLILAFTIPGQAGDLKNKSFDPLDFILVLGGAVLLILLAALVLCVSQIHALKAYYRTGRLRTYHSDFWIISVLQFFLYALILASGGTLSPIGATIWTVYYVKNRRRVLEHIRSIEGVEPRMA